MDAIGGGVLVAAAAALWIAYLLPSWLRRRQYLATERNAVRLQQTLRILAETAETPEPVRVEATAREVAAQQRILHEHEEAARLAAEAAEHLAVAERRSAAEAAAAARELAAAATTAAAATGAAVTEPLQLPRMTDASPAARSYDIAIRARRSLRRRRGLCSLLLLASLLTAVGGAIVWASGATPFIAAGGGLGVLVAATALVALARVRLPVVAADPVVRPSTVPFEPIDLAEAEPVAEQHEWTPQPLPKPLHLSRGTIAAAAMASIEAAEQLRRTELEAEVARRAEQAVPKLAPAAPASAAPKPTSPYARMGIVDVAEPALDDLDAVLRRRRRAI
ncbi:hypothetical protein [Agromyces sp. Marseille-P2726]|uniref:hypothetical protein n=1 Tax=Agromyces sp. Marseille-P2726 TaxID=2709132 RepID=UPI001570DA40|nr:hypothetical protein [Agromyces sp. Marseille-P2726]